MTGAGDESIADDVFALVPIKRTMHRGRRAAVTGNDLSATAATSDATPSEPERSP